jgi:hypothetical protein
VVFEDVQEGAKASIPYIVEPDKAGQGPGNWYQIHLHAKVVFGAGTGHATPAKPAAAAKEQWVSHAATIAARSLRLA